MTVPCRLALMGSISLGEQILKSGALIVYDIHCCFIMFHLKKYVNHDDQEDYNQQHSKAVKFPVSTFQAGDRSVFSGNKINFETLSIFVVFCT